MQILINKDEYEEVYEPILRKSYRCAILLGEKFNLSEDEFINLCLSDKKELCTFKDLVNEWLFNGKYKIELNDFNELNINLKIKLFRSFMSNDVNIKMNEYLNKCFQTEISNELMLANIIYMIETVDDFENTYLHFFMKFPILENHNSFLYIFSIIQITEMFSRASDIFNENTLYNAFFMNFNDFFNYVKEPEVIAEIIGEPLRKIFRKVMHCYILSSIDTFRDDLFLFIKHFDTYKWLDDELKIELYTLAEDGIFYKEHAKFLSSIGDNKYLSKMTMETIKGTCIIV